MSEKILYAQKGADPRAALGISKNTPERVIQPEHGLGLYDRPPKGFEKEYYEGIEQIDVSRPEPQETTVKSAFARKRTELERIFGP